MISFKQLNKCMPSVMNSKIPVLLRGRHGIGKSQLVYQVSSNMGLPVVERRASQMTEGDLLGVPSPDGTIINGEEASRFKPFEWLVQACTEPVILFFDEIDRATLEVRQGIFELTDSRKLAGWKLHSGTMIVGAINGGIGGDYQVGEMDPAELDRWSVFDVEPSFEDWKEWARDNISPVILNFLSESEGKFLEVTEEIEPSKVYPSRRSWDRLNQCCVSELSDLALLQKSESTLENVYKITESFVGFEAAVSFIDFVKNYEVRVSAEDVFVDGNLSLTKEFTLNQHCSLIDSLEEKSFYSEKLSKEIILNSARYFLSLPSEAGVKFWTIIGSGDMENIVSFHKTKVDEDHVAKHLVGILKFEEEQETKEQNK